MQFPEQRLPNLSELDVVNRPVYINAAQGGVRTNGLGKAWFEAKGVTVAADGTVAGGATGATLALKLLREQFLTPESRKRNAFEALSYYAGLGITTHLDNGAFQSDAPSGGVANENTYTMHNPFLALDAEKRLPARLRFNYLHQDPPNDPTLPTLSQRLKNSFPFFGNDWMRSGGIGEFTGGGINGLRAIAAAGWRAEDHTLNLASFQSLVESREMVHAQIPITNLRWVISHVPQVTVDLVNRFKAMGGGLLVGWGPLRTGTNVGPVYRMLFDNGIHLGYHSDGGDITVINPWLNFYTMITGKNLKGDVINAGQTLTRDGDALARDGGEQVVHRGRRPWLDRGGEPRGRRGTRQGLFRGARRGHQAHPLDSDCRRRQGRQRRARALKPGTRLFGVRTGGLDSRTSVNGASFAGRHRMQRAVHRIGHRLKRRRLDADHAPERMIERQNQIDDDADDEAEHADHQLVQHLVFQPEEITNTDADDRAHQDDGPQHGIEAADAGLNPVASNGLERVQARQRLGDNQLLSLRSRLEFHPSGEHRVDDQRRPLIRQSLLNRRPLDANHRVHVLAQQAAQLVALRLGISFQVAEKRVHEIGFLRRQ